MKQEQWMKIVKGAGIAIAGALLVYVADSVVPFLDDHPIYGPVVASVSAIAINAARKWLESMKSEG
jgi:hypothetical protein